MKNLFLPIIIFIGIGFNLFAQEKSHKELKGDKYFFNYSFDKAIVSYTHVKQLSIEGQHKLAVSYHNLNQNIESEAIYLQIISAQEGVIPEDYWNYASVLKINGKYDEAGKWMDKFAELKPDDLRAKSYLANKATLPNLIKDPGKYKVVHMNINSDALDFGTSYFKDKIVFASTRGTKGMIGRKYNWTRKNFWDIYVSEVEEGQLKKPKIFDKSLNSKLHDGPVSFSHDGTQIAFTRNNYDHVGSDRVIELQIFFSSYKDGKWLKPVPFVLNSEEYSVGQPCLTSNGKTMFFTSDMPGGYGGTDIYRITKDSAGVWGKAENLGNKINTEGDEMFPFYEEKSKTLFFASNGRFGLGGLDIFICKMNESGFGPATNAGFPLNTQYDDFALIMDNEMSKGYFSSNRTGGSGGDDIYSIELLDSIDVDVIEDVNFIANSPENKPAKLGVREYFPLRNYIFFITGSTEPIDRYVLLKKEEVEDFQEDQLEVHTPLTASDYSSRQMRVYYNILNILADRMKKNPSSTINLVGSSAKGKEHGLVMAESVKNYMVNIFGIDASRISIESRLKPKIPSEQPGGKLELDYLREEDERVTVESSSAALLMEFQSGPDASRKPVEVPSGQEAPINSNVTFKVVDGEGVLTSWSLELEDESGKVQYLGPYTENIVGIPGKSILGDQSEGNFKVTMTGLANSGNLIKKDTTIHVILWSPSKRKEGMRFSIIYEFNHSKAISIYEKYLTDIVIPKIPKGATVIISGYTDIIGQEAYNQKLSLARANDVRNIMGKGLSKLGRSDIKFEVNGFGEDQNLSLFGNHFPEERFYNRTVIIDVVPKD